MKSLKFLTWALGAALLFLGIGADAQNLVANSAMTPKKHEPCNVDQLNKANGISNANGGTADLYSADAGSHTVGIPENSWGVQSTAISPHYAGIITYYTTDKTNWNAVFDGDLSFPEMKNDYVYAEYLQFELAQPMVAGQVYTVNFKASMAENSAYATRLGAYLSSNKLDQASNEEMALVPQVKSASIIYDENGWQNVSGAYVASGGEKYLTIGRFKGQDVQEIVSPTDMDSHKAYYYISDPTVTPGALNVEVPVVMVIDFDDLLDGKSLCLPNLNFETNSAKILPSSYEELNSLAEWIVSHPDIKLQISGYTDKTGTDEFNLQLSKDRAASVKKYLTGKGVNDYAIDTEGYGSSNPIDQTHIASLTNRRVEICLKK
jgi:outer membrane protein OmpA-like peptidoglycan-associated protein